MMDYVSARSAKSISKRNCNDLDKEEALGGCSCEGLDA